MNVAAAPVSYNNGAQFFPDVTGDVGKLLKTANDQTLVVFDYTSLLPVGGTVAGKISYTLDTQTNPQLIISKTVIPDGAKHTLSFVISAGVEGVVYGLTVSATLSDESIHLHVLHVNVVAASNDGCCVPGGMMISPIAGGLQQANLSLTGVYGNDMPKYFVSPTEPTGAKVFDRWYNSTTGMISDYVTDGISPWWQSLYSLDVNLVKVALYYFAGASQITFDTTEPDIFGNHVAIKESYALDVSVNGVRVMPMTPDGHSGDYTINISASTVTFDQILVPNDVVIFDIVEIA